MDITIALHKINPNLEFGVHYSVDDVNGTPTLSWLQEVDNKPTDVEIQTVIEQLKSEWEQAEYIRNRIANYPSITEQLDMLYWDNANGTKVWQDKITEIKSANPKK